MADVSVVSGVLILIPDVSGRWLCVRRSSTASAPGQVGFPGGKVEPGESPADAVAREGFEELGTLVTPLDPIATHYIPRYAIELTAWTAALDASQLNPSPG